MKFMMHDKVSYIGKRHAQDLQGKLGEIVGRVDRSDNGVVVDFGEDVYVMDETKHLTHFQGFLKGDKEEKKDVEVKKRRPSRGKKQDQEEDSSE